MRRWSFVAGAVLILLGLLAILNAVLGVTLHLFWPVVLIALGAWIIFGISRGEPGAPREQASVPLEGACGTAGAGCPWAPGRRETSCWPGRSEEGSMPPGERTTGGWWWT